MTATVTVKHFSDHTLSDAALDDVDRLVKEPGLVWIDVLKPDAATFARLGKEMKLPELAVEDALKRQGRAKLDIYTDMLFAVWIVPERERKDRPVTSLRFSDLCFFVTDKCVVTTHPNPVKAIEELCSGQLDVSAASPAWLIHAVLDRTTDDLLDSMDVASERLDDLENDVFERADKAQLQTLYSIKRRLLELRKVVQGERDVIRELARTEAWVGRDAYMYYQDVGDHLARIADEVDTYFDVAVGIMDIYLSAQNNRMNEIMKQLTVVATIFMPLAVLTGVYGMNLLPGMWPPPLAVWSFGAVCASMVVIVIGMLWYFRRRNWW